MASEVNSEPGVLETDSIVVRTMREDDLNQVVAIDATASGRRRPQYFELMIQRALKDAALQISLVAELEGAVVGFLIASLYYGEYGLVEPAASIDAIGVHPDRRGNRRQGAHATAAAQSGCASHPNPEDRGGLARLRAAGVLQERRLWAG